MAVGHSLIWALCLGPSLASAASLSPDSDVSALLQANVHQHPETLDQNSTDIMALNYGEKYLQNGGQYVDQGAHAWSWLKKPLQGTEDNQPMGGGRWVDGKYYSPEEAKAGISKWKRPDDVMKCKLEVCMPKPLLGHMKLCDDFDILEDIYVQMAFATGQKLTDVYPQKCGASFMYGGWKGVYDNRYWILLEFDIYNIDDFDEVEKSFESKKTQFVQRFGNEIADMTGFRVMPNDVVITNFRATRGFASTTEPPPWKGYVASTTSWYPWGR